MNTQVQDEIENAIWEVQRDEPRETLRYICLMCKRYLNEWDVKKGKAVCWYCRKIYFPEPKNKESLPAKPIKLVPQKDGSYLVVET